MLPEGRNTSHFYNGYLPEEDVTISWDILLLHHSLTYNYLLCFNYFAKTLSIVLFLASKELNYALICKVHNKLLVVEMCFTCFLWTIPSSSKFFKLFQQYFFLETTWHNTYKSVNRISPDSKNEIE